MPCPSFRHWEIARPKTKMLRGGEFVHSEWIVDASSDALRVQCRQSSVAVLHPDYIQMVDASIIIPSQRDARAGGQNFVIAGGMPAACGVPIIEASQFDPQDCCLKCIKSTVLSHYLMMVFFLRTPVAQKPNLLC